MAERALARLNVWKIIQGEMWRPDKHRPPSIILVCCFLHNIVIDLEDEVRWDEMPLSHEHDVSHKQQFCDIADNYRNELQDKSCQYLPGRLPPWDEHWTAFSLFFLYAQQLGIDRHRTGLIFRSLDSIASFNWYFWNELEFWCWFGRRECW